MKYIIQCQRRDQSHPINIFLFLLLLIESERWVHVLSINTSHMDTVSLVAVPITQPNLDNLSFSSLTIIYIYKFSCFPFILIFVSFSFSFSFWLFTNIKSLMDQPSLLSMTMLSIKSNHKCVLLYLCFICWSLN